MRPLPDDRSDIDVIESHFLLQLSPNGLLVGFPILDPTSGSRPQWAVGKLKANQQQLRLIVDDDRSHGLAKGKSHTRIVRTFDVVRVSSVRRLDATLLDSLD